MWQELIVGACVLLAVAFVIRRYWPAKPGKSSASCGGCSGCSGEKSCPP